MDFLDDILLACPPITTKQWSTLKLQVEEELNVLNTPRERILFLQQLLSTVPPILERTNGEIQPLYTGLFNDFLLHSQSEDKSSALLLAHQQAIQCLNELTKPLEVFIKDKLSQPFTETIYQEICAEYMPDKTKDVPITLIAFILCIEHRSLEASNTADLSSLKNRINSISTYYGCSIEHLYSQCLLLVEDPLLQAFLYTGLQEVCLNGFSVNTLIQRALLAGNRSLYAYLKHISSSVDCSSFIGALTCKYKGESPFYSFITYPKTFMALWLSLAEDERLHVLRDFARMNDQRSIFYYVAKQAPVLLWAILFHLVDSKRQYLLHDKAIIDAASLQPASMVVLLSLFTEEKQQALLLEAKQYDKINQGFVFVLNELARQDPAAIAVIYRYVGETFHPTFLTQADSAQKNLLDYMAESSRGLNDFVKALPRTMVAECSSPLTEEKKNQFLEQLTKKVIAVDCRGIPNNKVILTLLKELPHHVVCVASDAYGGFFKRDSDTCLLLNELNFGYHLKNIERYKNKSFPQQALIAAAEKLLQQLRDAESHFLQHNDKVLFLEQCKAAITEAKPLLSRPRWQRILNELFSAIVSLLTLGIVNYCTGRNAHSLFFNPHRVETSIDTLAYEVENKQKVQPSAAGQVKW